MRLTHPNFANSTVFVTFVLLLRQFIKYWYKNIAHVDILQIEPIRQLNLSDSLNALPQLCDVMRERCSKVLKW